MIVDSSATTGSPAATAARTSSRTTNKSSICIVSPYHADKPGRTAEDAEDAEREKSNENALSSTLCVSLRSPCSLRLCGSPRFHVFSALPHADGRARAFALHDRGREPDARPRRALHVVVPPIMQQEGGGERIARAR